jgi:CRISPR/Cas system CMR-associated protein Cmr5 small subunit
MTNLEQLRARYAQLFWSQPRQKNHLKGDECARKLAALVAKNGLLATVAYAKAQSVNERPSLDEEIMCETGRFMTSKDRNLLPFPVHQIDDLLRGLSNNSTQILQQATAETLHYLAYMIRLAPQSTK